MFSNIIAFMALIVSFISLIITYKFTKRQTEAIEMDSLLNVSSHAELKNQRKKAKLIAYTQFHDGRESILVENQGKATAVNIRVDFDEEFANLLYERKAVIEELGPNEYEIYRYVTHDSMPSGTKVSVHWDDDFNMDNEKIYRLNW